MKKIISFYTIDKFIPVWFVALLTFCVLSALSRAEDWGPYLGPVFPSESDFDGMDDDYRPNAITNNKAKQLPLPKKQSVNRQAAFDGVPSSNETIIPQRLLIDEPMPESLPIPVPKPSKKKPHADFSNSATHPAPLNAGIQLNEGEFIVDESNLANLNLMAPTADSTNTAIENYNGTYGGVYDEVSPAMASNYFGPMIIKPFGTGLLDNVTVFGGVTGFKNELDNGRNGNFGFTEGINWSGPATPQGTVSGQVGFRAVQSNINGNSYPDKNSRNQYFLTAGLFKRDLSCPIQGGAVIDWFQDDYYGKVYGEQIRCELSARTFSNTEYGFIGAFGLSKKSNEFLVNSWFNFDCDVKPQQYYLLFLRKHFSSGGVAEFRSGMTQNGDTVLAGLGEFPLSDRFSLNGGFSAMIPKEGHAQAGSVRESWEVSVGMTFYFRGGAFSKPANPCRPMFEVAGNGSFFNRIVKK